MSADYGADEAERLAQPWEQSFVSFQQWSAALCPPGEDLPQPGWSFRTVMADNDLRD